MRRLRLKLSNSTVISLLALIVSVSSASFSFMQYRLASSQFTLSEQQLRPYVKDVPRFLPSTDPLGIDMLLENFSPLPAKILFSQLTAWIDKESVGWDFHTTHSDLLYQHKGGLTEVPPIEGELLRSLENRQSRLTLGVCAVYASTAKHDSRVWLYQALYEYEPGSSVPVTRFIDEQTVAPTTSGCVARELEVHLVEAIAPRSR